MPRRPFLAALLAATVLGSSPVAAQGQSTPAAPPPVLAITPPPPAERPASIDSLDPTKVPVFAVLLADGHKPRFIRHDDEFGLNIWFITMPGNIPKPIYTSTNGKTIVGGHIYGAGNGQMTYLTGQHFLEATAILASEGIFPAKGDSTATTPPTTPPVIIAHGPEPGSVRIVFRPAAQSRPQVKGADLIAAFDNATWIEAGPTSAPLLYAVVDPECSYCHEFTQSILPAIEAGKVRVRFIVSTPLAGGNNGKSTTSATAILSSPDRFAAWAQHTENRPLSPAAPSPADIATVRAQLAANDQMRMTKLDANGLNGVPFLLYRNKDGKLGYQRGIKPADIAPLVAGLGTLHAN